MSEAPAPWLARPGPKALAGLGVALCCALLYSVPSALTQQRALPIELLAWERAIPFIPLSVWPYLAQYPLLLWAYFGCRNAQRCAQFLLAVLMVQAGAALCYLLVPLRYPRELYQASPDTDALTLAAANWVRSIDAPVNCCPSLHVTSCLLCLWLLGFDNRPRALAVGTVALASMASTLTFKQHYGIDIVAGALLAAAGWCAAGWMLGSAFSVARHPGARPQSRSARD